MALTYPSELSSEIQEHYEQMEKLLSEEIVPRINELHLQKGLSEGEVIELKQLEFMAEQLTLVLSF